MKNKIYIPPRMEVLYVRSEYSISSGSIVTGNVNNELTPMVEDFIPDDTEIKTDGFGFDI